MPFSNLVKERLSKAFSTEQAEILVELITESHADLVKVSDFNDLKKTVNNLVKSQEDLAKAQKQTYTELQDIKEEVHELKGQFQDLKQEVHELKGQFQDLKQEVHELKGQFQDLKQEVHELKGQVQQTQVELRNLARQVGGLSEAFGGSLEAFAIDVIPEFLENHWKMQVSEAGNEEFQVSDKSILVDIVIRGEIQHKPVIVMGEVKSNLTLNETEKFFNTVREIIDTNPKEFQNHDVKIIFFGYRVNREARDFIKSHDGYMIFTHGKIL